MRDSRDAKAMAQAVRAFLADHGVKITNSQSLELMARRLVLLTGTHLRLRLAAR
jgi:hypothetical protein